MKQIYLLLWLFLILFPKLYAQDKTLSGAAHLLNINLKPFYHGVASGDPLSDRVIIWTRVSPQKPDTSVQVIWKVAKDPEMKNIVRSGIMETNQSRDFTVKIDVTGLQPGTTYFYSFLAYGKNSPIGRAKTTPSGKTDHLRFAVVSCNNYQAGYFNAFARIAERNDLDAVIHLGDYIYEYGNGFECNAGFKSKRRLIPEHEIKSLTDYRQRYSLYRLDADLQKVHQVHPFIVVWDDHESANDSYKDGAKDLGNNQKESSWENRKAAAKRAYSEWLPIRGEASSIYRTIQYGDLAEIIMLDTRLEGREKQLKSVSDTNLFSEERTMLGVNQKSWFLEKIKNSKSQWKVIGNQVIFSEFNIGWAAYGIPFIKPAKLESLFLDIWDGYPVERNRIIDFIGQNKIENVVFITGDVHSSYAFDVALHPSFFSVKGKMPEYESSTGRGSSAVEFVTPSITSANFDEKIGKKLAVRLESQINKPLRKSAMKDINPNPHMKYADLTRHGYFILDLTEDKAQADWFFVDTIKIPSLGENLGESWFTYDKSNHLEKAIPPSTSFIRLK